MEYSINLILSLLCGIVVNTYDDIIDNKLQIDMFYVNITKYFAITLFSILFYNDIVFSLLWFSMAFVSFLMDIFYTSKLLENKDTLEQKNLTVLNDDTWVYSLLLSGLFIIYHIFTFFSVKKTNQENLNSQNVDSILRSNEISTLNIQWCNKNLTLFISLLLNIFIVISDTYFTPEHASDKKLYARIVVLIVLCIFVYYMTYFTECIYEGNYSIMLMTIGILISSICFLTLDKFHVFDNYKVSIVNESVDSKEESIK